MIRTLARDELTATTGAALGANSERSSRSLIRYALRRAAFHLAPASRAELVRFAYDPLMEIGVERDAVEETLDELIVYGDLFEMRRLQSDPWDAPSSVIRPAPPSFVARPSGAIVILGVSGELPTPLTPDLEERLDTSKSVRILHEEKDENLPGRLTLLGLVPLSEAAWLRAPRLEAADAHAAWWQASLAALSPTPGGVPNLEMLDPGRKIRFYKGRWTTPATKTDGVRLVRRPQDYGAPLWSIAEFRQGLALRVADLHENDDRQSPQDLGWRFQAALDASLGHPQEVGIRTVGSGVSLDFFSPLPAFVERRLALAGTKTTGPKRLFSFEMSEQAAAVEVAALQETMWMRSVHEGDVR